MTYWQTCCHWQLPKLSQMRRCWQAWVPIGGIIGLAIGGMDGATIGGMLGGRMAGMSSALLQSWTGLHIPLLQS
jgi:hypothetical protein